MGVNSIGDTNEEATCMKIIIPAELVKALSAARYVAAGHGAAAVEINPTATVLTPSLTYSLRGPSGQILPALLKQLPPQKDPFYV